MTDTNAASSSPRADNMIRQYLAEIRMAPILEEFVAETVAERPNDIYAFMEAFARRKRAELSSQSTKWTLLRSWAENAGKDEESLQRFADSFFQLLFITQRTMRRTVFGSIADTLPQSGLALAKLLDRAVHGNLSDHDMAALAATSAAEAPIESYHYQAIVSTLLLAVRQSMAPEVWEAVSEEWNDFTMSSAARVEAVVSDAKAAAQKDRPDGDDKDGSSAAKKAEEPAATARELWDKMPMATQQGVVRSTFDVLFTQHAPMKRTLFGGVDIDALIPSLHPLLEKLVCDTLTDEDIQGTGAIAAAVAKGGQAYHVQYGVTALLMAVSMSLGRAQWGESVADAWRSKIFAVGERITAMLAAAETAKLAEAPEAVEEKKDEREAAAEENPNAAPEAEAHAQQTINEEEL